MKPITSKNHATHPDFLKLIASLQEDLEEHADAKTKAWFEAYLKGVIPYRGLKTPPLTKRIVAWRKEHKIASTYSLDEQVDLAISLLRLTHAEDKFAGTLMLQRWIAKDPNLDWQRVLRLVAGCFDEGYVKDWSTCDWLCLRGLKTLAVAHGEPCARAIASWSTSKNLWRRRASGVTFVSIARHGDDNFTGFTQMLLDVCTDTIQSQERFAQTGTGWVLREIGKGQHDVMLEFIDGHLALFNREGLRYALEKTPKEVAKPILKAHKELGSQHHG